MLRKLFLMLRVGNSLNEIANLMFALRYFDVSGLLEVVKSHLGEFYFLTHSLKLSYKRPKLYCNRQQHNVTY